MADQGGASGDAEQHPTAPSRISVSEGRSSRRVSRVSYKEDYANLDEYGKLVKYASTFRDASKQAGDENIEMRRVWYAPWKKRKVRIKTESSDGVQFPEDWLITDIRQGLPSSEIHVRRRAAGWNELVSEKVNPIAQILGYFRGPILYGMSLERFFPIFPAVAGGTLRGIQGR